MDTPRRKSKIRISGGTKLAIGGAVILFGVYAAWTYGVGYWITSKHFSALRPGKVSLIGLQTGHGYSVLVSNRAAQLVEAKDYDFTAPSGDSGSEDGPEGASKKRIPVREMIQSLDGDEKALSIFVAALGSLEPKEDWPTHAPEWSAEDITKALAGDATLTAKLEQDLNVHLDGKPMDQLNLRALDNGIMIITPVAVKVQVGDEAKTLHARIKRWYLPRLMTETAKKFEKLFKVTPQEKVGYYLAAVKEEQDGNKFEDVRSSLKIMTSDSDLKEPAEKAERILGSAQVVLTDAYIDHASYAPSEVGVNQDKKSLGTFDLDVHVTDEGRYRLWQYSKLHPHDQILLVSNGVAIAAPRIKQELVKPDLTIIQMPDEGLLQQAVSAINDKK